MPLPVFPVLEPELKKILDNFSSLFDIRIAYFRPDGSEYEIGENRGLSQYCHTLRSALSYDPVCRRLDGVKLKRAAETGKLQSYVCHGGCHEAVKPILQDGELLGFIMIGQSSVQKNIPDPIRLDAEKAGLFPFLNESFNALPRYDRKKLNEILELFSELTDLILLKNLVRRKELGPVKTVIEHMKNHGARITLREAAALAGMSESRFRHRFREETGLSFSRYRTTVSMNRASRLLLEEPALSVQEISERLGYDDPLYFSRAFRTFFGSSPRNYRKDHSIPK